MNTVRKL